MGKSNSEKKTVIIVITVLIVIVLMGVGMFLAFDESSPFNKVEEPTTSEIVIRDVNTLT